MSINKQKFWKKTLDRFKKEKIEIFKNAHLTEGKWQSDDHTKKHYGYALISNKNRVGVEFSVTIKLENKIIQAKGESIRKELCDNRGKIESTFFSKTGRKLEGDWGNPKERFWRIYCYSGKLDETKEHERIEWLCEHIKSLKATIDPVLKGLI